MGSVSSARSIHGMTASGSTTSTGVSGSLTLGVTQSQSTLEGVDVFYSFSVTSTGASDVATLDLSDGTVSQTTGTPTITDGDGKDFEGETLPTLLSISGVYIQADEVAAGTVQVACADTGLPDITFSEDGAACHAFIPAGKTLSSNNIVFTFDDASSQKVTVIVAGKTT